MDRLLWCFARGSAATGWEAICVDLDIAVEGQTFEDAKRSLELAVCTYVADAGSEAPDDRARLLNRRAPFHVRLNCWVSLAWHVLASRKRGEAGDLRAGFDLACPA